MERHHKHVVVQAEGKTLEEAFENAWTEAKEKNHGIHTFDVLRISLYGTNPISGYVVVLGPPSGAGGGH